MDTPLLIERHKIGIIRIFSRLNIGGPSIHVILLTEGLDRSKFESVLVVGRESAQEGNMLDLAVRHGVNPVIITWLGREISLWNDLRATITLWLLLRKNRPLIVHTHTSKAGFSGRLAAHLAGVPVIVHTFHGHVFSGYFGPFKTKLFIWLEKILAVWSSAIITVSDSLKAQLLARKIAAPDKIEVVPLGLNLEPFLAISQRSNLLREEMGLAPEHFLVGIVGRLVPIKDHRTFLEAAKIVMENDHSVRFVVVGDGELRSKLDRMVQNLGLEKIIYFAGWRMDLAPIYADLDLVALSSRNEGTPVSIIEGSASGKPVVATRVGGVPDMITHGWNGLLVPPENPLALANAILQIKNDPAMAEKFAARARKHAAENYSAARLINNLEDLYLRLIKLKGIKVQCQQGLADTMEC
jgi:glycosyltransferase involved in cell wall biosynthesis